MLWVMSQGFPIPNHPQPMPTPIKMKASLTFNGTGWFNSRPKKELKQEEARSENYTMAIKFKIK